jgi:hypothetical protein
LKFRASPRVSRLLCLMFDDKEAVWGSHSPYLHPRIEPPA